MAEPIVPGMKSLNDLQHSINSAIDSLDSDGSGGEVELPASRAAASGADDDSAAAAAGDEDKDTPTEGEESEAKETPSKDEDESEAGASGEGEAPSPTDEAQATAAEADKAKAALASLSPSRRNAVAKFLPDGRASSMSELAEAESRADEDYWRLQGRLAEREESRKATPAAETEKKEPPPTPAELQHYDQKLQLYEDEKKVCNSNIDGWNTHLQTAQNNLANLNARKQRGDASVEDAEIVQAHVQIQNIQGQISTWRQRLSAVDSVVAEVQHQRGLTRTLLDTQDRLAKQETESAKKATEERTRDFSRSWAESYKTTVKDLKIPPAHTETFKEFAVNATFVRIAEQGPIKPEEMPAYLSGLATKFMKGIQTAKTEGAESYAADKRKDAPKPPAPKQNAGRKPGAPAKPSPPASLRELQRRVNTNPEWDKF